MPDQIPASIRSELDMTPEWWDRQYRALIRKNIPRDHAFHADHNVHTWQTYGSSRVKAECIDCRVALDDCTEEA